MDVKRPKLSDGPKNVGIVVVPRLNATYQVSQVPVIADSSGQISARIVIKPFKAISSSPSPSKPLAKKIPRIKTFMSMTQTEFYKLISTEETCLRYLEEKGLLLGRRKGSVVYCKQERRDADDRSICASELKEDVDSEAKGEYKKVFKCSNDTCNTFVPFQRINKLLTYTNEGNDREVSICQVLELVWMWCHLYPKPLAKEFTG